MVVLLLGVGLRLAIGGVGVGNRSALVMTVLLTACAWLAARVIGGARIAFLVGAVAMALFSLAALPARDPPPYDDLEALYSTDQSMHVQVAASPEGDAVLTVLAKPVLQGAQARFGVAADVNGNAFSWRCAFQSGVQQLALPLPPGRTAQSTNDVTLRLTGAPSRDGDYLLVYSSARRGGFLISIVPAASVDAAATHCALG
jgi:hypothetical protein